MSKDWFRLSLKDGGLQSCKPPRGGEPRHWIERDAENLLALNPDFLDVSDQQPLRLGGVRGTVTSPDQAYLDELGRLTVVEFKRIRASLPVIAQVSAYATHWQLLPPGELFPGLEELTDEGRRAAKFGRALSELSSLVLDHEPLDAGTTELLRLGRAALKRISPGGPKMLPSAISQSEYWTHARRPLAGAPPRMIVVAPGFTDECIEFAEDLSERMVPIELVQLEIVKERGQIYVGRRFVHRLPSSEPTWRMLREIWKVPIIQESFVVNGWADALNHESFSLSAKGALDARFWLHATDGKAQAWTVVPDGWHRDDRQARRLLRQRFIDALPVDLDPGERWLEWEFAWPKQSEQVAACASQIARAILEVLVPASQQATKRDKQA